MTRFNAVIGTYSVDSHEAIKHLQVLFRPDDLVAISGKRNDSSGGLPKLTTAFYKQQTLIELLQGPENLRSMCYEPSPTDVYLGISTVKKERVDLFDDGTDRFSRVNLTDIDVLKTIFTDIDLKDTGFENTTAARQWLDKFCSYYNVPYTLLVDSGSGGLHVYWRIKEAFKTKMKPSPMDTNNTEEITQKDVLYRWWTLVQESASGAHAKVDRLVDLTRMSRLAGSIHTPRNYGDKFGEVRIIDSNPEVEYSLEQIKNLTQETYMKDIERVKNIKRKEEKESKPVSINLNLPQSTNIFVKAMQLVQEHEESSEFFNKTWDWYSILSSKGWTFIREGSESRQEWARPGRSNKSAVVGWEDSPDMMSLLSTSPDTNLLDLLEANTPLTKWRVFVRFYFDDNFEEANAFVNKVRLDSLTKVGIE